MKITRIEIHHIDGDFIIESFNDKNECIDVTKEGSNIEDVFADIREFLNQGYF